MAKVKKVKKRAFPLQAELSNLTTLVTEYQKTIVRLTEALDKKKARLRESELQVESLEEVILENIGDTVIDISKPSYNMLGSPSEHQVGTVGSASASEIAAAKDHNNTEILKYHGTITGRISSKKQNTSGGPKHENS